MSNIKHTLKNGCRVKKHFLEGKRFQHGKMECMFCETHNVVCCNCGWEFGWHYGRETPQKVFFAKGEKRRIKKNMSKIIRELRWDKRVTMACKNVGITITTYHNYLKDEEFAKRIEKVLKRYKN